MTVFFYYNRKLNHSTDNAIMWKGLLPYGELSAKFAAALSFFWTFPLIFAAHYLAVRPLNVLSSDASTAVSSAENFRDNCPVMRIRLAYV